MCDDGGEGSAYAFCEPGNRSHSLPAAVHFTGDLPSLQAMPNLTLDALPALEHGAQSCSAGHEVVATMICVLVVPAGHAMEASYWSLIMTGV